MIASIAGPVISASGLLATQLPDLQLLPSGENIGSAAPDHAFITGITRPGVVISVIALSGKAADPRTCIEIEGTQGTMRLRCALPVQLGAIDAELAHGSQAQLKALPAAETPKWAAKLTPAALNVALAYRAFSEPSGDGLLPWADAHAAAGLHRLLDTIGTTPD